MRVSRACLASVVGGAVLSARAVQGPRRAIEVPGAGLLVPVGWQVIWTPDAHCLYAVPADWVVPDSSAAAFAQNGATLRVSSTSGVAWAAYRRRILDTVHPTSITEDAAGRLTLEHREGASVRRHRSVSDGTTTCAADLDVAGAKDEPQVMTEVVESIRVSHEEDRRWVTR